MTRYTRYRKQQNPMAIKYGSYRRKKPDWSGHWIEHESWSAKDIDVFRVIPHKVLKYLVKHNKQLIITSGGDFYTADKNFPGG